MYHLIKFVSSIRSNYEKSELSKDHIILKTTLDTMFLLKIEDELDECTDLEVIMKVGEIFNGIIP